MTISDYEKITARIKSGGPKKLFLDSDCANEIDDQFAVTYAMLADDIELLGLGGSPFVNNNASSTAEGMEKSYRELLRMRDLVSPGCGLPVYRGADRYLPDRETPVGCEAADAIVEACRSTGDYVFIAVTGCFTDAASALIKAPDIKKNAVFILIGANDPDRYKDARDFNLAQDIPAAQVLMGSGANVMLLPAMGGTEVLLLSLMECAYAMEGRGIPAGDYLTHLIRRDHGVPGGNTVSTCHIMWDIGSIAFLRGGSLTRTVCRGALTVDDGGMFAPSAGNMGLCKEFDRDAIFTDLFGLVERKAFRYIK
ncbi:MAG: nucleoside hydrolase [Clostridiales bacterium]|nr:nucleoside hydrolase [Clostridiales bacterium]